MMNKMNKETLTTLRANGVDTLREIETYSLHGLFSGEQRDEMIARIVSGIKFEYTTYSYESGEEVWCTLIIMPTADIKSIVKSMERHSEKWWSNLTPVFSGRAKFNMSKPFYGLIIEDGKFSVASLSAAVETLLNVQLEYATPAFGFAYEPPVNRAY